MPSIQFNSCSDEHNTSLPHGIVSVLQMPFDSKGKIDEGSFCRLIEDAIVAGVNGLLVPVVASEVAWLSSKERQQILYQTAAVVKQRVPLIVGASSEHPEDCKAMAVLAEKVGAAAYLIAVPAELYETPEYIPKFFQDATNGIQTPLIIQDLQWVGAGLTIEVIRNLKEVLPVLSGLKIEVLPAGPKYTAVREMLGPDFYIAGGWAITQMIEALDRGVDAMIPESSMIRVYAAIYRLYKTGKRSQALKLFYKLLPVLSFTNQEIATSVAFFKRLLVRKGIFNGDSMRMPGFIWDKHNRRIAEELIEYYMTLEKELPKIG